MEILLNWIQLLLFFSIVISNKICTANTWGSSSSGSSVIGSSSFRPIQVMCEINGFLIPAIIDTGAEITVMSANCAKRCRIASSIDTKYSGKAVGVGTSEIIGGIDNLGIRIGPVNFQNKVSILRSSRCDLLIGLDVLRRFNCDISLVEKHLKFKVKNSVVRVPIMDRSGVWQEDEAPAVGVRASILKLHSSGKHWNRSGEDAEQQDVREFHEDDEMDEEDDDCLIDISDISMEGV